MRRRVLLSGTRVAALSLMVAVAAACGGGSETTGEPTPRGPVSEGTRPATSALTDPASGASCGGNDVRVTKDDFSIVLDGTCGAIVIEASRGSINVDTAGSVTVRGDGVTVLNSTAGDVTVAGSGNTLNLTGTGAITVTGDRNTVLVDRFTSVRFTGSDNVVNTGGKGASAAITDQGRGNKVV